MVFQPQEARQAITMKYMWTKSIQANLVLATERGCWLPCNVVILESAFCSEVTIVTSMRAAYTRSTLLPSPTLGNTHLPQCHFFKTDFPKQRQS